MASPSLSPTPGYDLSTLKEKREFTTGDGITSVKVTRLKVSNYTQGMVSTVEPLNKKDCLYHVAARKGDQSPLAGRLKVERATIAVKFTPKHPGGSPRSVTFEITETSVNLESGLDKPLAPVTEDPLPGCMGACPTNTSGVGVMWPRKLVELAFEISGDHSPILSAHEVAASLSGSSVTSQQLVDRGLFTEYEEQECVRIDSRPQELLPHPETGEPSYF